MGMEYHGNVANDKILYMETELEKIVTLLQRIYATDSDSSIDFKDKVKYTFSQMEPAVGGFFGKALEVYSPELYAYVTST